MMTVKMFINCRIEKAAAWRSAWNALANSDRRIGRWQLQSQQEYIEHRAQLANLRIAELMRVWDLHKPEIR